MAEKKPLSKKQVLFLRSKKRLVIYRGGIRSGKTWVLCLKALEYARQGKRFCIVSFSYPILRDVCIFTMKQILNGLDFSYTELISDKIIIVNGQEILFRSGDAPDSLRGLSLHGFGIDEAREFKSREIYDIMIGRLSNSKDAQAFITTSPKGKNWVSALEGKPGTETIIQRTEENPFLPKEYITALREQYTSDYARQELDADIVEFGAGIINPAWFNQVNYTHPDRGVRFWDMAVSIKTSADFSAGALCSFAGGRFTIHHIAHGRLTYPDLRDKIIECARSDGQDVIIGIEDAGQQRGFIDDLAQLPELRGYIIRAVRPRGDKLNRAITWASRAQLGLVDVCKGPWAMAFSDECASFTADDSHEHDDMVDAVSGAYEVLSSDKRVFNHFVQSAVVKLTIDWTQTREFNKQYIGFYQNHRGEISVIACIWDPISGKLYIYWGKTYDNPYPNAITEEIIRECRTNIVFTQLLGNSILMGDGRSPKRILEDSFRRAGVVGAIREPQNYDLDGSIMYADILFHNGFVVVSDTMVDVVAQFSGWTYQSKGKIINEDDFGYCMALCLIASEIRKIGEQAIKKPFKIQDYQAARKDENPKKEVPSWQLA